MLVVKYPHVICDTKWIVLVKKGFFLKKKKKKGLQFRCVVVVDLTIVRLADKLTT